MVLVEPFLHFRQQGPPAAWPERPAPTSREAIRPHVLGGFATMLRGGGGGGALSFSLVAAFPPAMRLYLDNGARSARFAGRRGRQWGPRPENIAPRNLELHKIAWTSTSQADVTHFAMSSPVGASFRRVRPAPCGEFTVNPRMHEPAAAEGDRQDLCRMRGGSKQGRACCRRARHRTTAARRHQAGAPLRGRRSTACPGDPLSKARLATTGDLKEMAKTPRRGAGSWASPTRTQASGE